MLFTNFLPGLIIDFFSQLSFHGFLYILDMSPLVALLIVAIFPMYVVLVFFSFYKQRHLQNKEF